MVKNKMAEPVLKKSVMWKIQDDYPIFGFWINYGLKIVRGCSDVMIIGIYLEGDSYQWVMYKAVAPPDQTDDNHRESKKVKGEEGPPAGISESNWEVNYR